MTAWQTGLSRRDSILMFAQVMGFVKNENDEIDYLQLEKVLDYYGKTSCSFDAKWHGHSSMTIDFKIGGCIQVIFTTFFDEEGFGKYPDANLSITVVDEREMKRQELITSGRDIEFKGGRKYRCNLLGGVCLDANQVAYIFGLLSKIKDDYDEWNYFMESW